MPIKLSVLLVKLAEGIAKGSFAYPLARAHQSEGLLAQTGRCTGGLMKTVRSQWQCRLFVGRVGESRDETIDALYKSKKRGDRMHKINKGKK